MFYEQTANFIYQKKKSNYMYEIVKKISEKKLFVDDEAECEKKYCF